MRRPWPLASRSADQYATSASRVSTTDNLSGRPKSILARRRGAIQFDSAGAKVVKSPEDNAKACTDVSDGRCARSLGGFTFRSGERSYSERPRLPAARPLPTRRRHDRSLWDRRLVPSFGLARVGPSFFSIGQMVRSREPADTLLRRWGLATRLPRRHARRQDPLCLRRRNLHWRRASTEGRRRLSHVLRRSLIARYVVLQMIGTTISGERFLQGHCHAASGWPAVPMRRPSKSLGIIA